jgi:uncharacterized protein (TIGR03437 family)
MFLRLTAAAILAAGLVCVAQTAPGYVIRTVAGMPRALGDGGPATSAILWSPRGVSIDAAGNVYVADTGNARIRRVTPAGDITTVAGITVGYSGDNGPSVAAQLSYPTKAVVTPNGDMYIADAANNRIRRVSVEGGITTIAGSGKPGFGGDGGPAAAAELNSPFAVAVDRAGNLYVADTNNERIRRITPQGQISTVAGSGLFGYFGDNGPAARAAFALPRGVAVDPAGNVYVSDTLNNRIRKITPDGTVSTIAGSNGAGSGGDGGPAGLASLNHPAGITVDNAGNIYFADSGNHRVRRISAQGVITTVAGSGENGFGGDNGPATAARLSSPQDVALDAAGNVYIADTENHRVRKVSPAGIITTIAGSDPAAGDGGPATSALLFHPAGVAVDASGAAYVSDTLNNRIRQISPGGVITTIAGTGAPGYAGDGGPATRAQLHHPEGLALDAAGNLFVADTGNNVIRKITSGVIRTVAGTGEYGNNGDSGPALEAQLANPNAVALDNAGRLYIADSANNRVRMVDAAGVIRPVAGDPKGQPGAAGNGGAPDQAKFTYPRGLAVDANGNVYISDYFNCAIWRVAPAANRIAIFAGAPGSCGNGAKLNLPAGIVLDSANNLYVADLLNFRVLRIAPNGAITPLAGNGAEGYTGDGGLALQASFNGPRDVAVDSEQNVYIADEGNNVVRKLALQTLSIDSIVNAASGIGGAVAPGEIVTITGAGLGPAAGVSSPVVDGAFSSSVSGVSVLFDGAPAPLLYVSDKQINVIAPYTIAGHAATEIEVQTADAKTGKVTVPVRDAAPGIFTLGGGQGAIVNQDGTVNSPQNPASAGSIISIYATGEGVTDPPGTAGRVASGPLPHPVLDVRVRIEGLPADIQYAGAAPGAAGLFQVNVWTPQGVFPSDRAPVELTVGSFAAQPGVTVAIK